MKKIFALAAVAVIGVVGAFAFDLKGVEGTWQDTNWDANWTLNAGGTITLTQASTGEVIKTFTDSNISNFKAEGSLTSGVSISFYCKDTGRTYKFTKPVSLGTDLTLDIDRDWTDEAYSTSIKSVK